MVKIAETLESKAADAERIFHDYKQAISQAFEKEKNRLTKLAEQEANQVLAKARQESSAIITGSQQEAEQIVAEARQQANVMTENIIAEAQQKAEQIINEAEKRAKREAKEKTKREVERITRQAKEEAAKLVAAANQKVEQIASKIKEKAQRERDQLVANAVSTARSKSESEAVLILAEARKKAEKIIIEAKSKLRADLEKSALLVLGAQQRSGKVIEAATREAIETERPGDIISVTSTSKKEDEPSAVCNVEPETGNALAEENDEKVYKGRLELDIVPPIDFNQLVSFKKLLLQVPNLRLIGMGGSEDGPNWAEVECSEPLPLVTILKQLSPVKKVTAQGNHIIIALNGGQDVQDYRSVRA